MNLSWKASQLRNINCIQRWQSSYAWYNWFLKGLWRTILWVWQMGNAICTIQLKVCGTSQTGLQLVASSNFINLVLWKLVLCMLKYITPVVLLYNYWLVVSLVTHIQHDVLHSKWLSYFSLTIFNHPIPTLLTLSSLWVQFYYFDLSTYN